MTNRFSSLISLLNLTAKQGRTTCEFPADTLGINTLRLLRDRGFIWGFHFVSPKKRQARLFPRVKIFLKFIDSKMPILKAIRVFKKTRSNYTVIQSKYNHRFQNQNKYLLLTNPNGLFIMSHADFINMKQRSLNKNHSAKLLAEVFI